MLPECCYDYRYDNFYNTRLQVDTCEMCGNAIYKDEEYYDVLGVAVCKECIKECKREAEI